MFYIRELDFVAAQKVDYFIANSQNVAAKIKKYYKRDSIVIYPFINFEEIQANLHDLYDKTEKEDYFALVTRLASWKRVDIAIEVCKRLGLMLKVVGKGPDLGKLRKLANENKNIVFLNNCTDQKKFEVLANSLAVINTQYEDFGIVPLEAMACGKPVVALGRGGVLETVVLGKTGEFFAEQTPESLEAVLKGFYAERYKSEDCVEQAKKFDVNVFRYEILEFVKRASIT